MLFLSSPPQSPPQSQFFGNPFAFQHTPTTPSPLRTSYNANGSKRDRMSNQTHASNNSPFPPLSSPISKPSYSAWLHSDTENQPTPGTSSHYGVGPSTIDTSSLTTPSPTAISFSAPFAGASEPTNYARRSRASVPSALLSAHATARKAHNKERFLDRIRTRRDEWLGRDERVLRADYLAERKRWEEEMRKTARSEIGVGEVDDQGPEDGIYLRRGEKRELTNEEGMSPTEEREIEALLEFLDEDKGPAHDDDENSNAGEALQDIGGSDGDSQEWDEVFMEVLSQGENPDLEQRPLSAAHPLHSGDNPVLHDDGSIDVEMS